MFGSIRTVSAGLIGSNEFLCIGGRGGLAGEVGHGGLTFGSFSTDHSTRGLH